MTFLLPQTPLRPTRTLSIAQVGCLHLNRARKSRRRTNLDSSRATIEYLIKRLGWAAAKGYGIGKVKRLNARESGRDILATTPAEGQTAIKRHRGTSIPIYSCCLRHIQAWVVQVDRAAIGIARDGIHRVPGIGLGHAWHEGNDGLVVGLENVVLHHIGRVIHRSLSQRT